MSSTQSFVKRTLLVACLGSVILTTASCSLFQMPKDETVGWPADKLYTEARDSLNKNNYSDARELYQKLAARYPYGRYAQQAMVEVAYSYYKEHEPAAAIASCDRFLRLYPEHPLAPYALYIKAMATLDEDDGWMRMLTSQDLSKRDAQAARDAFDLFKELVLRFPNSRYAKEARQKMYELVEAQAKYEVNTARYYYDRKAYIAAINRAQNVLNDFQTSPQAVEALNVMLDSYKALKMDDKAADIERILAANKDRPTLETYLNTRGASQLPEAPAPEQTAQPATQPSKKQSAAPKKAKNSK